MLLPRCRRHLLMLMMRRSIRATRHAAATRDSAWLALWRRRCRRERYARYGMRYDDMRLIWRAIDARAI